MRTCVTFLGLLLAAFVVLVSPAWAQDACQGAAGNLVANCGFETGDFTGWTQSGNTGFTGVTNAAPWVFSGSFGAFLGPVGSDGYLTQFVGGNSFSFQFRQDPGTWGLDSVVVSPFVSCGTNCELYYVSFYLYNAGAVPNDFTVLWNGVDVGPSLVDAGQFDYTQVSGFLEGSGSAPIPEPSSLVLLGTGLMGVAGGLRRRLLR